MRRKCGQGDCRSSDIATHIVQTAEVPYHFNGSECKIPVAERNDMLSRTCIKTGGKGAKPLLCVL